ncbi:MAG: LysM peptidoglycan-binding domain-containing protein [Roseburia sp.]|nr:LysM peptidoglycan-binding domain-containing protein [Anaeroplasma bactoclasticum]MCM1197009.1 LysM peptidoglycan-binding domain-containing protein [Roseburia sp.]MCM1557393.1 LysM peptidoglycan-binding domain-containing protein [Anaeroplasma bactoclasticum]
MLEHIVKNGETIHDILNMYHIELKELTGVNLHITDFYNLASGMKIKIPLLHNEIEQILENTESFVQKYYPKVNEFYEEKTQIQEKESLKVEELKEEKRNLAEAKEAQESLSKETIPLIEKIPKKVEVRPKGRPYPGILPPKNIYGR